MYTYNIIVVGASGSGKTVFLASMFHKLSTQTEDTRFFLNVPTEQRQILLQKYHEVADTSHEWPPTTLRSEISQWNFTCRVRSENTIYSALAFNYWDYAGEIMTDYAEGEQSSNIRVIEERFRDADALLGLIDGHKVYTLMKGEPHPGGSILFDLDAITTIMENNKNPIHFIITKWDLLHGKYSLKEVRDRLLSYQKFNGFVQSRIQDRIPIRLIPVSSVGMGFAELITTENDAIMKKSPGADPNPFQVEAPLACVLPDKLRTELDRIIEQQKILQQKNVEVRPEYNFWDILGRIVGRVASVVRANLPEQWRLTEHTLRKLEEFSASNARAKEEDASRKTEQLRHERDGALKSVRNEETALDLAVQNFMFLASKLKRDFPESDLLNVR